MRASILRDVRWRMSVGPCGHGSQLGLLIRHRVDVIQLAVQLRHLVVRNAVTYLDGVYQRCSGGSLRLLGRIEDGDQLVQADAAESSHETSDERGEQR